jgi:hypothetical protein
MRVIQDYHNSFRGFELMRMDDGRILISVPCGVYNKEKVIEKLVSDFEKHNIDYLIEETMLFMQNPWQMAKYDNKFHLHYYINPPKNEDVSQTLKLFEFSKQYNEFHIKSGDIKEHKGKLLTMLSSFGCGLSWRTKDPSDFFLSQDNVRIMQESLSLGNMDSLVFLSGNWQENDATSNHQQ